jgi:EpsD family peptidyl-prolyl cis-trans isomerase
MLRHSTLLTISAAAALVLAGCNGEDKKPATQVAAKVNKEEVSVHQINGVLARTPKLSPENAKAASRQILERLIDQELLVQQAVESKLDRDPKTVQAIETARREILARSYLEKLSGGLPRPNEEDIKGYYAKHPELFAERRIYNFNELAVGAKPDLLPQLQERMSKAKSLADVGEWLKGQNVPMAANNTTKPAEQLPLELLPRFHAMKEGQIGVIPSKDSILIVQLAASKTAPMDEKAATPFIQQFLANQRRVEAVDKEVKSLREKGKVEYMGEFAQAAPAKVEAAAPKAAPAPTATASAPAASPSASGPAPVANASAIDKGIAGLR